MDMLFCKGSSVTDGISEAVTVALLPMLGFYICWDWRCLEGDSG